jgi:hypothetical protein
MGLACQCGGIHRFPFSGILLACKGGGSGRGRR